MPKQLLSAVHVCLFVYPFNNKILHYNNLPVTSINAFEFCSSSAVNLIAIQLPLMSVSYPIALGPLSGLEPTKNNFENN